MQQSSETPKNREGYRRLLHSLNPTAQGLLVSLVFGMVSSLHHTSFLHLFHSFFKAINTGKTRSASLHSCCTEMHMRMRIANRAASWGRATEVVTYKYGVAL